jgi:hypothetical protein
VSRRDDERVADILDAADEVAEVIGLGRDTTLIVLQEQFAEYGHADVGPMVLLRSTQIVRFGSGSGDEWGIGIAA